MADAEAPIRRIVVAIEPSVHGRAALEAAASIAERLGAELVGLYVEDVELLTFAAHPFAREFSMRWAAGRTLSGRAMSSALRSEAERARALLADTAGRHRVPWSFAVRRGEVASELVAAVERSDLLVLGRTRAAAVRHRRLGSTVRRVVGTCTTAVLVVPGDGESSGPVVALFEDADRGPAVVAMAAALAGVSGRELVVLVSEAGRQADAEAALAASGAAGRVTPVPADGLDAALAAVAPSGRPTLVAHRSAPGDAVLERVACPVVLVG